MLHNSPSFAGLQVVGRNMFLRFCCSNNTGTVWDHNSKWPRFTFVSKGTTSFRHAGKRFVTFLAGFPIMLTFVFLDRVRPSQKFNKGRNPLSRDPPYSKDIGLD
uniref:Uncharacterized protein n=1 Tax=Trichuris muris TaxID=70415 RepID=A0A5S6QY39_TRIMR